MRRSLTIVACGLMLAAAARTAGAGQQQPVAPLPEDATRDGSSAMLADLAARRRAEIDRAINGPRLGARRDAARRGDRTHAEAR